jgi:phosphate transport system substrate-binding protein
MKIENITSEQLKNIYNGKIKTWKELGGPDRPISVVSRDTSSGTYEVWEEKILKGDKVRPDALLVASNGQAVQTVAGNKYAIGYIGIGYIDKSTKALKVNGKQLLIRVCVMVLGLLAGPFSCTLMENLQEQ